MTDDITSRARQLLVDIGLKEPAGDPPEIVAQYDVLVDRVADHLRQVAAEAAKERDELRFELDQTDGVHQRAQIAESALASLRALLAEAGEALDLFSSEHGDDFLKRQAALTLAKIQSALRDASPTMGKPK